MTESPEREELVDAIGKVKHTEAALLLAFKALEEAKERVYDVYNGLLCGSTDGYDCKPESDEELREAVGKRSQNKLAKIAYQCWVWGSELAEMLERLEQKEKGMR